MSYARFGWDGSDVYVFTTSNGIECCGCLLQERHWVENPKIRPFGGYFENVGVEVETIFRSNDGMVGHLLRHRRAGHTVPQYAIDRLLDPRDAADNEAIWQGRELEPDQ